MPETTTPILLHPGLLLNKSRLEHNGWLKTWAHARSLTGKT